MTMALFDRRHEERVPSRDEFEILRASISEMRSTLATMNEAMDRIEQNQLEQRGENDANGSSGDPRSVEGNN